MNYRHSVANSKTPFSNFSLNPFLVSRSNPRFGLKGNNDDSTYCIYALFRPPKLPSNYVEHKVSRKEFEV
jgi:hypothetical protein